MDLLENFDSNMVFMEKAENTMALLGSVDHLVENLWEAERIYYQHFDLNFPVPVENNIPPCGLWFPAQPQVFLGEAHGLTQQHQTARDVEVIDDDIAIISPNTFDQARKKARRNPDAEVRENINIANQAGSVSQLPGSSQAVPPSQFPGSSQAVPPPQFPGSSQTLPPPQLSKLSLTVPPPHFSGLSQTGPPPPAPVFCCPICMDEMKEATSTKCGHVFCKSCIEKALAVQKKCPTCRMKCIAKSIFRIFLPAFL
ncbi:PREDICTED: polyadenylation factor subunit 2-like isoform X2 [Populus euphratica]|uniref:Polyadenylation factor subunit 2-like isoform X2 n=1 Tax=Populus euphratica TaxID=75702 RepID=A0AAJ6XKV5_POPEU|nr:PREDICTED: polyadenylation factor subunit 2-like isoform X2 [Populus euphratica]